MIQFVRLAAAPAYLLLCLLLGGSPQGVWGTGLLQMLAVVLIAWAIAERREEPLPAGSKTLVGIILLTILLGILQLVPLSVTAWPLLPGRDLVVSGFSLLGLRPGAMPLSLAPYDSLSTLLAVLPALGMIAATLVLRAYRPAWLAGALVAGTIAGIILGILQASSPAPESSPWYPYRVSNFGVATGFFANSNHMASLLLVSIAFIAALGARFGQNSKDIRNRGSALAVAGGGLAVVIVGLLLNRSLAGYGLGLAVLLASMALLFGSRGRFSRAWVAAAGLASLLAVIVLWSSPIGSRIGDSGAETSISSRQQMFDGSVELIRQFGLAGTGIGTYAKLYPLTERSDEVGRVYVNHAHNDYLELAIETGIPGVLLILAFLGWWAAAVWRMLRSPTSDQFALAGAIASAAILLHSLVDYPLRTSAMSAVFAACLALILQSRKSVGSATDLRPVRHLVVG